MPSPSRHHAFHMAFHRGEPCGLILLAEKSQNFPLGQFLLLEGSRLFMCCNKKVFQWTLVGFSPLMMNLASKAEDMLIGSSILTFPKTLGKIRVF